MKPAPPVTRIRMLAWIKQQLGTHNNQDPDLAGERDGDPSVEIALSSPGRTWRSGAARGSAAGGWRCARRCCHWSPSAPSRRAEHHLGPTRSKPNHPSEKSHSGRERGEARPARRSRDCKQPSVRRRRARRGAHRSSWLWGLGSSACLARTHGGLNRIRLGADEEVGGAVPPDLSRIYRARANRDADSGSRSRPLAARLLHHHTTTDCLLACCYQPGLINQSKSDLTTRLDDFNSCPFPIWWQ